MEGVGAPHDIALAASPMPVKGTGERTLAVFVAETKPAGSMLRKFLFVPQGHSRALAACIMHAGSSFWLGMGLCGLYVRLLTALAAHLDEDAPDALLDKQVCGIKVFSEAVAVHPAGNCLACCQQSLPSLTSDHTVVKTVRLSVSGGVSCGCTGMSMPDMVEAGVMEADQSAELIPGGHGVEAHLAHAHQVTKDAAQPLKSNEAHTSVGNVVSHKLHMPTTLDPLAGDPALTLPGHVLHQNHQAASDSVASDQDRAGSVDDLAMKREQAVHKEVIQSDIPESDARDMVIKEEQRKLRSQVPISSGGIVGHHAAAQPQSAGFGTAVSQLSSFGMPFAGLFAVAAVVLWKRLGDLQPLTAHGSQFAV